MVGGQGPKIEQDRYSPTKSKTECIVLGFSVVKIKGGGGGKILLEELYPADWVPGVGEREKGQEQGI